MLRFRLPSSLKDFLFKRYFSTDSYYYKHSYLLINKLLKHHGVDLIFDVGANKGQYAKGMFLSGYNGKIVSFEPILECHDVLLKESVNYGPNWKIADRMALGAKEETLELNVSANLESSSLLTITPFHTSIAPMAATVRKEKTVVKTLDSVSANYFGNSKKTLLKLDVQGYEHHVLLGAVSTLQLIECIQIELPLTLSYEKEQGFDFMHDYLSQLGFEPYQFFPACIDGHSGRFTHVDVLYFRKSK